MVSAKTASWLDSSALLAMLYAEPGMEIVARLLEDSEKGRATVFLSTVTFADLMASLGRTRGEELAREELTLLFTLPALVEAPAREQCAEAGFLRTRHRLSTADAIIAVQAMAAGAELVHKDPEFETIVGLRQRPLPCKSSGARRR